MKTVLITGADGFVGKNLRELFEKNNSYKILSPSILELDLTDSQAVFEYFNKNIVDFIIHSASVDMIDKSYVSNVCELNLRMFFNLLRAKSSSCILYSLCSGSAYNRQNWVHKMSEDYFDKHVPMDAHSYSKYVISKYSEFNKNIVILRLFGIFGKYEDYRFKFISNLIAKNILNMPFIVNKNAVYDYLYIKDFYSIINKLITLGIDTGTYNITPTKSISLIELCNIVNNCGTYKSKITVLNEGYGKEYTGDNSKLLELINGYEFISYSDSIKDLYDFYKCNIEFDVDSIVKDNFLSYAKKIN